MKNTGIFLVCFSALLFSGCSEGSPPEEQSRKDEVRYDWSGNWNTISRSGRSRMELHQVDSTVTGSVQPSGAQIDGIARGSLLAGSWSSMRHAGEFVLTISPNGQTFAGRYDTGEWFNGIRDLDTVARGIQSADLSSPAAALRTFLTAFNQFRDGILTVTGVGISAVDFGLEGPSLSPAEKFAQALALFEVIDQCTFRIWELGMGVTGTSATLVLNQDGTDQTFTLRLIRKEGNWQLFPQRLDVLQQKLVALRAARGIKEVDPVGYRKRGSPRASMRAFLERFAAGNNQEFLPPQSTLDLSAIDETVRDSEGKALSEYLYGLLARVAPVVFQEIPDDPKRTLPYIHFNHPQGKIEIAPYEEDGKTVWKFSQETVRALRDLYSSFEKMPVVKEVDKEQATEPAFFRFRKWLGGASALFLEELFLMENWQWMGLLVVILAGWLVGAIIAFPLSALIRWRLDARASTTGPGARLSRPLRIALMATFWLVGFPVLRIPEAILPYLNGLATALMVIGGVWALFITTDLVGAYLRTHAAKIHRNLDDVFTSLIVGAAKIAIFVVGVLSFAEGIGLDYGTVLAGLGIGGLAFAIAAQDTIANFFGSAVVLADRPFRKGDLIKAGDIEGEVEKVGLRSSQIRTFEDSIYIVPNRMMANEAIDNRGRRRARRIRTVLSVTYDTPPDKLDAFAQGLRKLLEEQESVLKDRIHVGVWDYAASSIDLIFICYIDVPTWTEEIKERHRLFVAVTRLAAELGVHYAFPTRTVHLHEESKQKEG